MKDFFLPYLEWEVLHEPITISKVDDRTELPQGKKKIVVDRDEDYNLRGTLYFKDPTFEGDLGQLSAVAGSFTEGFDIKGSCYDSVFCTLETCVIGKTTLRWISEVGESLDTAILDFRGLRTKCRDEKEGTHLIEWYLNGPKDKVFSESPIGGF